MSNGNKKIFLPWRGFEGSDSEYYKITRSAYQLASEYHPSWEYLSVGAQKLMGRNGYQVLDETLDNPIDFIICYTKDGKVTGGTGQALRIAEAYNIPVYNLGLGQQELQRLYLFISALLNEQ